MWAEAPSPVADRHAHRAPMSGLPRSAELVEAPCGSVIECGAMSQAVNSLVAVVGTLLGVYVAYAFQRRTTDRTELRNAVAAFAAAVMEQRRGEYDRWWRHHEDATGTAYVTARTESYRLRSLARQELHRVRLLARDTQLARRAGAVIEPTAQIHKAGDRAEFTDRGAAAERALEELLGYASDRIR